MFLIRGSADRVRSWEWLALGRRKIFKNCVLVADLLRGHVGEFGECCFFVLENQVAGGQVRQLHHNGAVVALLSRDCKGVVDQEL